MIGIVGTLLTHNFFYTVDDPSSELTFTQETDGNLFEDWEQDINPVMKTFNDFKKTTDPQSNQTWVSQTEDEKYMYYQINCKKFNLSQDHIAIELDHGTLIFGVKKDTASVLNPNIKLNFRYSFPIPDNVDSDSPEILQSENKIVVKLEKKTDLKTATSQKKINT